MGQLRDPLVGRDLLFGICVATLWLMVFQSRSLVAIRMGDPPRLDFSEAYLTGTREALSAWMSRIPETILTTFICFFALFILRVVLRRNWLAGTIFAAIFATIASLGSDRFFLTAIALVLVFGIIAFLIFRVGVVALATAIFVNNLIGNVPFTLDSSVWYFPNTLFPLLSVVALAIWGFYTALAGQKLWKGDAFS